MGNLNLRMKFAAASLLAVYAMAKEAINVSGDVEFFWNGYHNVREVPDQAAFDKCDKSKAKKIDGGEKSGTIVKGDKGQTRYFICEVASHCKMGQKVAMTWVDAAQAPSKEAKSGALALQAAGAFVAAALLM